MSGLVRRITWGWVRWRIEHSPKALRAALDEVRDLWKRASEREGQLAAAVAEVVWKATPFGEAEDGDIYAYIVPKGAMHRLVGVAQSNGAHIPVTFRVRGISLPAPVQEGNEG